MEDFSKSEILICDDSITNVMLLSAVVQEDPNILADTQTDSGKAWQKLQEKEYDLLLLDLEMPHLSGFEILSRIRREKSVDELPVLIITGRQDMEARNQALADGANDFVTKPFDQFEVALRVRNLLQIRKAFRIQRHAKSQLEKAVEIRTAELNRTTDNLIHCLAVAGELKDNETAKHVIRVGKYARALAKAIGLPEEIAFMLEKAAPMHDIGKIGIPDNILLKKGQLTPEERQIMESHTRYGEQIFGQNDSLIIQMAKSVALTHHERWDGSGYCQGLKGESIPVEGRITMIADVFDALTSKRPYKQAWPVDDAVQFLREGAGKAFDPKLVEAFIAHLPSMVEIMEQYRDD
ncbi:MAG: response regulator [Hahellaceae bacterium]|nr:response regulator [Hahellaceae bacterium]MCP5169224.1 response regulator [Hahellaceae bacterium]